MRNLLIALAVLAAFPALACEQPMFAPKSSFAKTLTENSGAKQDAAMSKAYWADSKKFQKMHDQLQPLCTDNVADENSCLAACSTKSKASVSAAKHVEDGKHYALSADERAAIRVRKDALEAKWESRQ